MKKKSEKSVKTKAYYVRLPEELKNRLDGFSKDIGKPKSRIVIEALEIYLNEEGEDFSFAIEALEELRDGDHKEASKKIDKVVKNLKK